MHDLCAGVIGAINAAPYPIFVGDTLLIDITNSS